MRSMPSPAVGRLVDVYSPSGRELGLVTKVVADLAEPGSWRVSVTTRTGRELDGLPLFQVLTEEQRSAIRAAHLIWAEWRLPVASQVRTASAEAEGMATDAAG